MLNCIGKIFTSILYTRLKNWAEQNKIFPEEQYGFRENRRAMDCIFILNTLIEKTRANHSQLFLCYVDLKKAFESIQHNLLWKKLHALGVSGQIIRVLQSMYAKAAARVKLTTSEATKSFNCQKGVRQGSGFPREISKKPYIMLAVNLRK